MDPAGRARLDVGQRGEQPAARRQSTTPFPVDCRCRGSRAMVVAVTAGFALWGCGSDEHSGAVERVAASAGTQSGLGTARFVRWRRSSSRRCRLTDSEAQPSERPRSLPPHDPFAQRATHSTNATGCSRGPGAVADWD
jgi:hypothetical protein